jgi:uncharacterized cupin superfamily protein
MKSADRRIQGINRIVIGAVCAVALAAVVPAASAEKPAKGIVRLDQKATPKEPGKYPKEMVAAGQGSFDGSYTGQIGYRSEDRKLSVGLWQSEAGVLQTTGYPHDEYCRVLEGHLIVTNRDGSKDEFRPGDSFVIPKGWAGTWNMTSRFKKQYVAFEESPAAKRP